MPDIILFIDYLPMEPCLYYSFKYRKRSLKMYKLVLSTEYLAYATHPLVLSIEYYQIYATSPLGHPWQLDGKEYDCKAGDPGSISGLRRSPGEGKGYPLQYSSLEIPTDRGAWWATV